MEEYLFNSYIKFCKDNKKPFRIIMKNCPWWLWLLFVISLLGQFAAIALYDAGYRTVWLKIVRLASLGFVGIFYMGVRYIPIRNSKIQLENYRDHIQEIKGFLNDNGIKSRIQIEIIKDRIEHRLVNTKQELQSMKEHDEKLMQTLLIPVVLAIITTFLSRQGEIDERIAEIFSFLLVSGGLFLCFAGVVEAMRSGYKWKIANLTCFKDDLQGILDSDHFGVERPE